MSKSASASLDRPGPALESLSVGSLHRGLRYRSTDFGGRPRGFGVVVASVDLPPPALPNTAIFLIASAYLDARIHLILGFARHSVGMHTRRQRGQAAHARGIGAEDAACAALVADGWTIHVRRLRTTAGEVDAVAEKAGLLSIIEVKARPTLAEAAIALTARQQARLLGACEIILGEHPDWGANGVRFDVLVVDLGGRVRRIADAFRLGDDAAG